MSKFVRVSIARSLGFLSLLTCLAASFTSAAYAQTAPQLLPYTAKLIAGGAASSPGMGATCPVSGNTSTDAYGDGCLATEIQLVSARYAIADSAGNIFFSDYTNGLIRRVDAVTGVVTAAGGGAAASPAQGAVCGSDTSTDARGDGCPANLVKLDHPTGLAFSPAGDLYFADYGYSNVRKIAATGGLINPTGVISLVDGNVSGTYGYTSNNATTTIQAASQGYLDSPFGLAFDPAGNLYISDEYTDAVVVVNTNASTTTTVTGVSIPPGTVSKIVGALATSSTCPNSPGSPDGCTGGTFVSGTAANSSEVHAPYGATYDAAGNVYLTSEYNANIGKISPAGILTNYAGVQGTAGKVITERAPAGTFAIGSSLGLVADANSNLYITDASNGVIWRVDGAGQSQYVIAGGAATVCAAHTDAYGDGCPARQATFGSSGTTFASSTAPGPGIYGVTADQYAALFVGDTETMLIREIASGTQFGQVGANQPTQTVDIHFPSGDAASTYTLTTGATNFALGTAACTTNSDGTTDCLLPITATPTALGPFTGTLQVKSTLGAVSSFPLNGTYANTPLTRLVINVGSSNAACATATTLSTGTAAVLTATVVSTGSPTGSVTFFANGTQIGTPATVTNGVATLNYTPPTTGSYTISATYSGDSFFKTSSATDATPLVSTSPSFAAAAVTEAQSTVSPGETALYSVNLTQTVYTGNIALSCSGLPANSSCQFSPAALVATGCSTVNTVAVSILTQQATQVMPLAFGAPRLGWLPLLTTLPGLLLALWIGVRRRRSPVRHGQVWMAVALLLLSFGTVACGSGPPLLPATPAGTYTVTVTATGSTGTVATVTLPLTVK